MTAPLPVTARVTAWAARVTTVMPLVKLAVLVVLFLGTTACSLVMSASATMTYASHNGVPRGIEWSPVGMLELVSVAATLWYLTASRWREKLFALGLMAGTAAVTIVMGVGTYHWLGFVAPVGTVVTIAAIDRVLRSGRDDDSPGDSASVTHLDLDGWTKRTARERARELGVGQAGTVAEIVGRIREVEARQA